MYGWIMFCILVAFVLRHDFMAILDKRNDRLARRRVTDLQRSGRPFNKDGKLWRWRIRRTFELDGLTEKGEYVLEEVKQILKSPHMDQPRRQFPPIRVNDDKALDYSNGPVVETPLITALIKHHVKSGDESICAIKDLTPADRKKAKDKLARIKKAVAKPKGPKRHRRHVSFRPKARPAVPRKK